MKKTIFKNESDQILYDKIYEIVKKEVEKGNRLENYKGIGEYTRELILNNKNNFNPYEYIREIRQYFLIQLDGGACDGSSILESVILNVMYYVVNDLGLIKEDFRNV